MNPINNLLTYIRDRLTKERQSVYYEDTRDIQYTIGRPLTARELQVIFQMTDEQIYMIKNWLRESKNNESI